MMYGISEVKNKRPESCVFWTCDGMRSPFLCDHKRQEGETGRCEPRKTFCELEKGRDCGMFLKKTT